MFGFQAGWGDSGRDGTLVQKGLTLQMPGLDPQYSHTKALENSVLLLWMPVADGSSMTRTGVLHAQFGELQPVADVRGKAGQFVVGNVQFLQSPVKENKQALQ